MEFVADLFLGLLAIIGHFSIVVWLFNRLHAIGWPRKLVKALEKILVLVAAIILTVLVARWVVSGHGILLDLTQLRSSRHAAWFGYAVLCWGAAAYAVLFWLIPKLRERPPAALASNDTTIVNIAARLGFVPVHGVETRLLASLPGNEICRLAIQRKMLRIERLPAALDGLTIAHLSDLHMTGQLGCEFYHEIVTETNSLKPDLIVITGDIVEKEQCLPWIAPTLGRLKARHGKFFILGNHEKRLGDVAPLRRILVETGFIDLGSRYQRLTIRGADLLLAGIELPWFGTAPILNDPRLSNPEPRTPNPPFRILLSHTPDQLPWAKANAFDLMLAGHNHGGQIRLPYLGALIVPSKYGCRYAGGLYHEPPTLLHVSRGLAGIHPVRFNCPPELALLILKSG